MHQSGNHNFTLSQRGHRFINQGNNLTDRRCGGFLLQIQVKYIIVTIAVAVEKYFVKNPCSEIEIGIMDFDALQKELEVAQSLHKVAVRERDYERTLCDNYKKDYYDLRSLYEGVLSRINKLEDDTRAAIEFADLAEDDKGTEMILEFCEDITKLVGE